MVGQMSVLSYDAEPIKLDVGSYSVKVAAKGYTSFETAVDIPGKETVTADASLREVRRAGDGRAVPGFSWFAFEHSRAVVVKDIDMPTGFGASVGAPQTSGR
jgi:hypothetical protein